MLLTCETPKDYSWRLDPDSLKVNVFQQSWKKIKGHAFPAFYLIGRVPSKIRREKCTTIVITPVWQTQPRQTLLLNMSIQNLILLPQIEIFLKNAQEKMHPLVQRHQLKLVAWTISANLYLQQLYRNKLLNLYQLTDENIVSSLIPNWPDASSVAGLVNKKLVPFDVIRNFF